MKLVLAKNVILMEEDAWLKATAVKVVSIMAVFSLIIVAINMIPDAISVINYFVAMFGGSFSLYVVTNLTYFLQEAVLFAENV